MRAKARAARLEYKRQWNWRAWLPENWYRLGVCESGQDPPNWAHDSGTYVSAFGIYRPGYRDDARRSRTPDWRRPWRGVPTPWQQWQAALSHYRTWGDGWGCPGP